MTFEFHPEARAEFREAEGLLIDGVQCGRHGRNVGGLAGSVNGGMVSSLLLILVVTPVIFAMLRQRELQPQSPIWPSLGRVASDVPVRAGGGNPWQSHPLPIARAWLR